MVDKRRSKKEPQSKPAKRRVPVAAKPSRPSQHVKGGATTGRRLPAQLPSTPAVLILECDSDTLARQRITFADELAATVRAVAPSIRGVHIKARTVAQLTEKLQQAKEDYTRFDYIVIIGHSNAQGLQLTSDHGPAWSDVASRLRPFAPKTIILVACQAGRWLPAKALFGGIKSLRTIYGSPVVTTPEHASAVKVLLPYLLHGGAISDDVRPLAQIANFVVTGGLLFCQTRAEFARSGQQDGALWAVAEELLEHVAPELREFMSTIGR